MFTLMAVIVAAIAAFACLALIDQTGYVTIVPDEGSAGGRAKAGLVVSPPVEDREFSFSELTEGIMAQLDTAAYVMIDTVNRRIVFTDDAAAAATLAGITTAAAAADEVGLLKPVAGQTGKTLEWQTDVEPASDSALTASFSSILAPVVPKYSVASLLRAIMASQAAGVSRCPKLVIVDQENKHVGGTNNAAALASFAALTVPTTGNTGVIEVSASDNPTSPIRLPFEGGEV